jgi:molecular chaperone GrpE
MVSHAHVDDVQMEAATPTNTAEGLGRALRELEAAKARVQRDARAVEDETLDNLDRTIDAAEREGDAPAVVDGARLVRDQLQAVLRGYGGERVEAFGEPFDPAWMEAIAVAPVDGRQLDGIVVDQYQPGYRWGDALLRPAKVVVGRLS